MTLERAALTAACADPRSTAALGARLAGLLRPGDVVVLEGDLGSGKTTLTQGLAAALGVQGPATSPTFVLVNVHETSAGFTLLHADVYRLERLSEVVDLGLWEMVDDGAVAVVEWGERALPALPPDRLHLRISIGAGGDRTIEVVGSGRSWSQREAALAAAFGGGG